MYKVKCQFCENIFRSVLPMEVLENDLVLCPKCEEAYYIHLTELEEFDSTGQEWN